MKKFALLFIGICFFSCSDKKTNEGPNNTVVSDTIKYIPTKVIEKEWAIIPGKSVGLTSLEENVEKLSELGEPDATDSAMEKSWFTWVSKEDKKTN